MRRPLPAVLLATCLLLPAGAGAQATVGGMTFEAATEVRGARLQLNGAGTRYYGPFKVYHAALYLGRRAGTAEEVFRVPGPKRMAVTMLREIRADELGRLFTRGVEDNLDKAALSKLIPGLLRMSQIFTEHRKLAAGDTFTLDWVPGQGTIVSVRGVPQGEPFREPEFFDALMRIWIGPVPADRRLKDSLLGRVE